MVNVWKILRVKRTYLSAWTIALFSSYSPIYCQC